jgi:hypothetical protein
VVREHQILSIIVFPQQFLDPLDDLEGKDAADSSAVAGEHLFHRFGPFSFAGTNRNHRA